MPKDRTVTVRLSGGLGNQLFQYAAARSVAIRCDAELCLDVSFYHRGRHRSYELNQFPIQATVSSKPKGKLIGLLFKIARIGQRQKLHKEKCYHYCSSVEQIVAPIILDGYFQTPRYFAAHEETIRAELMPPNVHGAQNQNLAESISSGNSTILHIRRGDYVTNPKAKRMFTECPMDYYRRASERVPSDSHFFVFSDDIPWAKKHLSLDRPITFVGDETPRTGIEDLKLMSLGHHHIIANSTFSWWGAWLAGPKKGLTIAPSRWFVDESIIDTDLFPSRWIRI
ncbi:alpha-1,2-fucosyltransferase [Pirellulaceae bacterium SH449]